MGRLGWGVTSVRVFATRRRPGLAINALIAEIGDGRACGLLTGLAVIFSWGGILIGRPLFGLLLKVADSDRLAWLALAATGSAVTVTLPGLQPLAERDSVTQRAA